jgi:hypothetical protein
LYQTADDADGTSFDGVGGTSADNCTAPRFITPAETSSMEADATTLTCSEFVNKWLPVLVLGANASAVLDLVGGGNVASLQRLVAAVTLLPIAERQPARTAGTDVSAMAASCAIGVVCHLWASSSWRTPPHSLHGHVGRCMSH